MGRPNVNWNIGVAPKKKSTYISKIVKPGISFTSQVIEPDTKYIIKYDFDLDDDFTMPNNCILEFDGGSISGSYNITGKNTTISFKPGIVCFRDVHLQGSWIAKDIYSSCLDGDAILVFDNITNLSSDVLINNIYVSEDYVFEFTDTHRVALTLKSNTNLFINSKLSIKPNSYGSYVIIDTHESENILIQGTGTIQGDYNQHTGDTGEHGHGISIQCCRNIVVDGITVANCWGDGIYVGGSLGTVYNCTIKNCVIHACRRDGISGTNYKNLFIENCHIYDIAGTNPQACIRLEPNTVDGYIAETAIISNCILTSAGHNAFSLQGYEGYPVKDVQLISCQLDGSTSGIGSVENIQVKNSNILNGVLYYPSNTIIEGCNISVTSILCNNGTIIKNNNITYSGSGSTFRCLYFYDNIINWNPVVINSYLFYYPKIIKRNIINIAFGDENKPYSLISIGTSVDPNLLVNDNVINIETDLELSSFNMVVFASPSTPEARRQAALYVTDNYCDYKLSVIGLTDFYLPNSKLIHAGFTSERIPLYNGQMYLDQELGKPIWWNGTVWVDATGQSV